MKLAKYISVILFISFPYDLALSHEDSEISMGGSQCISCERGVSLYGEHFINNTWTRKTIEHAGKVKFCALPAYTYSNSVFVNFTVNNSKTDYGVRQSDWVATCK